MHEVSVLRCHSNSVYIVVPQTSPFEHFLLVRTRNLIVSNTKLLFISDFFLLVEALRLYLPLFDGKIVHFVGKMAF